MTMWKRNVCFKISMHAWVSFVGRADNYWLESLSLCVCECVWNDFGKPSHMLFPFFGYELIVYTDAPVNCQIGTYEIVNRSIVNGNEKKTRTNGWRNGMERRVCVFVCLFVYDRKSELKRVFHWKLDHGALLCALFHSLSVIFIKFNVNENINYLVCSRMLAIVFYWVRTTNFCHRRRCRRCCCCCYCFIWFVYTYDRCKRTRRPYIFNSIILYMTHVLHMYICMPLWQYQSPPPPQSMTTTTQIPYLLFCFF